MLHLVERSHHVLPSEALTHFDGDAFPGKNIDDRQTTEASAILQLIIHEIDRPSLVWGCRTEPLFAMPHGLTPLLVPLLQRQPLFLVEPIHQVLAHLPAFAS